jgi:ribosomal protein L15
VKLLWNGEIKTKINITVDCASASAIAAVEKAWGTLTILSKNVEEK